MAAVCVAVVKLRVDTVQMPYGSYTPGPQTLLLSVYAGSFLHHLLPLRDAAVWLENLLLTALCAVSAARFSHAQRRGRLSASCLPTYRRTPCTASSPEAWVWALW